MKSETSCSTATTMKLIIATILLSITGVPCVNVPVEIMRVVNRLTGPKITTVPIHTHDYYDFIIIGSGSGGSTIANRLSENPNWNVLLLEAGKPEGGINQIPIISSYFQSTEYNWGYKAQPQNNVCLGMNNRQCTWPRGKSLGGTSTINYMIHTRGNKLDYDEWAEAGNYGWSYNETLPYFKKSEKFDITGTKNPKRYHGTDGYLPVEFVPFHSELSRAFLAAGKDLGYKNRDPNGAKQVGFSYLQVNMKKGRRCSASNAYLRVDRPNLEIVTEALVTKILINPKNQIYGVIYRKNNWNREVYTKKEVILSAGTIDSARLLMLSGIGPRDHLEELGVEVRKDAPVGYNLYEHIGFLGLTFKANQSVTLLQRRLINLPTVIQWVSKGNGLGSIPGGPEALSFMRTKYARDSRPDMELLFVMGTPASDDGQGVRRGHGISDITYNTVFKPLEGHDAWSIWPILQNPLSYGRVKLNVSDPHGAPIIEPNFLTNPADIEVLLEGVKLAINVSKTAGFQKYGSELWNVKIPGCEIHDFGSDDYWRCAIRHLPAMMNHEVGTIKMGPSSDPNAIVDPELKVYGFTGLRVVDASIMPKIPVGHVNAGIFMIAEKAADMIKEHWADKANTVTIDPRYYEYNVSQDV